MNWIFESEFFPKFCYIWIEGKPTYQWQHFRIHVLNYFFNSVYYYLSVVIIEWIRHLYTDLCLFFKDEESGEITFYMKGADVVMQTIVQYNDWLEEEVWDH